MNEMFKRALAEALIPEYESSVPQTETEHEFSPEFEKKMNMLIRRQKKPFYMLVNTASKRVACVVACVALASSVAVMSSSALRGGFADFFMDIFTDRSVVTPAESDAEAPATIEEKFGITYDLSDYQMTCYESDEHSVRCAYEKEGYAIDFEQRVKSNFENIMLNTEGAEEIETISINGYEAMYFCNYLDYHYILWENEEYIFMLISDIGKNELIDIAESVQKVEN